METRGLVETGTAAVISGGVAAGTLLAVAGAVDWVVVVGLAVGAAIAAAANYRARTGHADSVATEAPEVTAENFEEHTRPAAGDGGTEPDAGDGDTGRLTGGDHRDASDGERDS